jgi:nicotinate-nucleotide adenylyltransferase
MSWTQAPDAIFFGGTFDPPHVGHRKCVEQALQSLPNSKVFVVPAYVPPAGGQKTKTPQASFAHRLAMSRLLFQPLIDQGRVVISDCEAQLPSPSYTVQTLNELKRAQGHKHWGLLCGFDQVANLSAWHRWQDLVAEHDLLIVGRDTTALEQQLQAPLAHLAEARGQRLIQEHSALFRWAEDGTHIAVISGDVSVAASRDVRHTGVEHPQVENWLTAEVLHYIKQHKLYGSADADS